LSGEPLEHVPRDLGPFPISDPVRDALAKLRHRSGVATARPEIDADRVRDVEIGVVFRFPNDLLALYAADVPFLRDRYELILSRVVAHTGVLHARAARGDLIGLGVQDEHCHICVDKNSHRDDATRLSFYDDQAQSLYAVPLGRWLAEVAVALPETPGDAPPFSPELSRVLPGGSPGTRVRHKVFGEGKVYVEIGDGPTRKVKVDFPKVGLKLLQARFLEYLDE